MNDLSAMQNQYDSDTDFSRDKEQQAAWTEKINRELYKLNEFAGYHWAGRGTVAPLTGINNK